MMQDIDEIVLPGTVGKTDRADGSHHVATVVVGGGQAGLSASYYLQQAGVEHVIFERHRIGHAWREERWDSFCLVTPNWQCLLPDFPYAGSDPHGFMVKDEIVAYLEAFARAVDAPLHEGVTVHRIAQGADCRFVVDTSIGRWTCDDVVMAISGYHHPAIPRIAERMPADLVQLHSRDYKNPAQLPEGAVLVVGTGQSGCQIAEDLHREGRPVHLSVGSAPRSPRRYRGRDSIDWLDAMGYYETTVDTHPLGPAVRRKANHYFTGRDGGHEIDLRRFAAEGMSLYGRLDRIDGATIYFQPNLARNLQAADDAYLRIRAMIDDHIARTGIEAEAEAPYVPPWSVAREPESLDLRAAGIRSVVWATGFRSDFSLVEIPAFDGVGYPGHHRGVSVMPGLYFLGLGWLWTWGSGRFSGIAADAAHVVETIVSRRGMRAASQIPAEAA